MPTGLLDLPAELQLQVLQRLAPTYLFHTVRLVSRQFQLCTEELFRHEILSDFELSLFVYVEASANDTIYSPSTNVQLTFLPYEVVPRPKADRREVVRYKLMKVDPPNRRERAVAKWRDQLQSQSMVMRMCLPPSYLITMRGKQWQGFTLEPGEDAEDDVLKIDWKKMVAAYFKETSSLEDIAGRFSSMKPMFPVY